ncbi:hypothetical protein M885DRAFT_623249 [Pelagophyceae sp. CCMP2097]|nr:hypothetical protein M885DRAFT_623249 [Pelagophyceae sp. CCMP2097]
MRGRSLRRCEVSGESESAFDPEMAGNSIVVVSRGGCSFEDKARNAEASGAAAVVVVNDARSIFVMADAGRPRASGLAAVMASFADAAELDYTQRLFRRFGARLRSCAYNRVAERP